MRTRLKICGVTNLADARAAVDCGVDILGFNFYEASPRYVHVSDAGDIINGLPFFISTVGILVRPTRKIMEGVIEKSGVGALQIYEPIDDYKKLPVPVILAVRMERGAISFPDDTDAEMILLDTFSKTEYGGTGRRFDWSWIPDSIPRERLILAGGINPGNIDEALRQVGPAVIDVAGGAESSPGEKDRQKMIQLVKKVRQFCT